MTEPGRNDPCPCGSGKKYKNCCMTSAAGQAFSQEDREQARELLEDFILEDETMEALDDEAADIFWGDAPADHPNLPDWVPQVSEEAFLFWFLFDFEMEPGEYPYHHFLATNPSLPAGVVEYVRQVAASTMRIYEITALEPGRSLTLRDVLGSGETKVHEKTGSMSMKQWELLAVRIITRGSSGKPEMEGAAFCLPRMHRERFLSIMRGIRLDCLESEETNTEDRFWRDAAVDLHHLWLGMFARPAIPALRTSDGQELAPNKTFFEVIDEAAARAALDRRREFHRDSDEDLWFWHAPGDKDGSRTSLGAISFSGGRLVLETLSRERAEAGCGMIQRSARDAVRFIATEYIDPQKMVEDALDEPQEAPEPLPEEAFEVVLEMQSRHYHSWVDESIPMLDGKTPREAARTSRLQERLAGMLRDLESHYLGALQNGQPAYDPTWMWRELGMEHHAGALRTSRHPPPLGHETLGRLLAGFTMTTRQIADRRRREPGFDETVTMHLSELNNDITFRHFIENYAKDSPDSDWTEYGGVGSARRLLTHLVYAVNYELHHRKTFWVDEELATMLGETDIPLTGELFRLPFASFAMVFTDRATMSLAERLLSRIPDCPVKGVFLKSVTVYAVTRDTEIDRDVRLAFVFGLGSGVWPYAFWYDLTIFDELTMEQILDQRVPGGEWEVSAEILDSPLMRRLVHLWVNAVLYATSSGVEPELRRPPSGKKRRKKTNPSGRLSGESVFYLPGKIDISLSRQTRELERAPDGRSIMKRFMVRGHWRRAPENWHDQRPRWIAPHWKGPDIATIIERQYRLKP